MRPEINEQSKEKSKILRYWRLFLTFSLLKEYKMTIQELAPFLQMLSADILTLAIITFLLTNIIKKFIPEKLKSKIGLLPFFLGILLSGIYSLIAYKGIDVLSMIKKGVQVGGVATFIYAFIKQLLKKDTLENTLTKILNGILDSSTLKTAVKKILEGYSIENEDEKNTEIISEVIKSSTAFSSEECKTISEIIINSLNNK